MISLIFLIVPKPLRHRVVLHGAPQFCEKLQQMLHGDSWDVRYSAARGLRAAASAASALRGCHLLYVRGGQLRKGRFLQLAHTLGVERMIMVWIGTDALAASVRSNGRQNGHARNHRPPHIDSWIARQTHWAVSPWVADEVRSLGLPCEHVTESFIPLPVSVAPLPREFSVLVFLPNSNPDTLWLYGWDHVLELAHQLPHVRFNLVGLSPDQPIETSPSIRNIGRVADIAPILRDTTVLLRLPRHDGLSWMVQEALAHARHVIYMYPFPACSQAQTVAEARHHLDHLLAAHQSGTLPLNEPGAQFIAREYNPATVRADIHRRWTELLAR